ncbi:hypothetical protein ACR0ST_08045 [Aliidiomarina sp. Khilg15.8]
MLKAIFAMSAAVLLSACASSGDSGEKSSQYRIVNDEGEVTHVCRNERTIGSNIGRRTCTDVRDAEKDREMSQAELERARRGPLNTGNN